MDNVTLVPIVPKNAPKHCPNLPASRFIIRLVICNVHIIMVEELRIIDDICRSALSDNSQPSDTVFNLDEVDETIWEAYDVPHLPCSTFPVQVKIGLGQREEAENRILLKHIAHDDAAPEVDPSYHAFSESDHLVDLAWQVPWQDIRDGRLQLQVFGAPLVRLRREDVQVVVPKVFSIRGKISDQEIVALAGHDGSVP